MPPPVPPPVPLLPGDLPGKPYNARLRVPLSLVGLVIALAPAPVMLFESQRVIDLWRTNAIGLVISIFVVTLAGSYLFVRALVRKRWVAMVSWILLALAFLFIDGAIGLFYGCLYALRNV